MDNSVDMRPTRVVNRPLNSHYARVATSDIAIDPSPSVTIPAVARPITESVIQQWEMILIAAVVILGAWVHGANMFNYPYLDGDEGLYMSQAWSVVHLGKLAPYTYWYDHAPAGWLLIALWSVITGGFTTFGASVNSGRVLMLILQVASTALLYFTARRATGRVSVALIVAGLFALSPMGIYFHRRVTIDNIATFWMIASLAMILGTRRASLSKMWLSAILFGLAVLSKESLILLLPVMGYLAFNRADKEHRPFVTAGWATISLMTVSFWVLLAILKGELFPTGTPLGGRDPHVSLIGTIQFQLSNSRDGGLFEGASSFWQAFHQWAVGNVSVPGEPILILGGTACAIIALSRIQRNRTEGIIGLATMILWLGLGAGGSVVNYAIAPLLPMLALNIGMAVNQIANRIDQSTSDGQTADVSRSMMNNGAVLVTVAVIVLLVFKVSPGSAQYYSTNSIMRLWQNSEASSQIDAINWVSQHVPNDSSIAIDDYMYTDLQTMNKGFKVYYYWHVDYDPGNFASNLKDDWKSVDYVITTPQLLNDAHKNSFPLLNEMINNSTIVAQFNGDRWPVTIRKVNNGQHDANVTGPIQGTDSTATTGGSNTPTNSATPSPNGKAAVAPVTTATPKTQPTQLVAVTPTPTTPPTPVPVEVHHFQVGDFAKADNVYALKVNSATMGFGDQYVQPKPGMAFITIDVSIKNLTTYDQWVTSAMQFTMKDLNGQIYGTVWENNTVTPDGKMGPGGVIRGQLVYEVPAATHQYTFIFQADPFSNTMTVWDLNLQPAG